MRIFNSHTLASLLTAFLFVVTFTLTGCTADSLTGPILDSETTAQVNGDDNHNNANGDDNHNNANGDDNHNNKNGDDNHNN